ncbi:MAG: cytochrome-c peroxidase [Flavobacteriales bacterium]|nr:cytochrome-c peroxidase [Flavobacteriales bacterium]
MKSLIYISIIFCIIACQKVGNEELNPSAQAEALLNIPEGFPEMLFPKGNELTAERWELGKRLFYDKALSIDKSISCGSCHKPALAFADDRQFSDGAFNRPGTRNAPSLANVGYQPYLLREGSVSTLEMQVLVPIQEHNEFNHNIVDIAKELQKDSTYVIMSLQAYNRVPDAFVITRAISNFQRTILSGNSNYDKYINQGVRSALNTTERRGMTLFFSSQTNCSSCHGGFNFSNYSFENNGLDSVYTDNGRLRFTNDSADEALFKVPSLRNVGLTAPYMHDGRFSSLKEVVNHYNSGGKNHRNKSALIQALSLTDNEKSELVAFLYSLTDYEFVNDLKWNEN